MAGERRLVDLSDDECWALLSTRSVGRLAWHGPEGISVVPLNYVVDGQQIVVAIAPYSSMARECDDAEVAFEVDHLVEESRAGWSALARGRCRVDYDHSPDDASPDHWPTGARPLHLRVEVDTLTGRRLAEPAVRH